MKRCMVWHCMVIYTWLYLTSVDEEVLEACQIFATLDGDIIPSIMCLFDIGHKSKHFKHVTGPFLVLQWLSIHLEV